MVNVAGGGARDVSGSRGKQVILGRGKCSCRIKPDDGIIGRPSELWQRMVYPGAERTLA